MVEPSVVGANLPSEANLYSLSADVDDSEKSLEVMKGNKEDPSLIPLVVTGLGIPNHPDSCCRFTASNMPGGANQGKSTIVTTSAV